PGDHPGDPGRPARPQAAGPAASAGLQALRGAVRAGPGGDLAAGAPVRLEAVAGDVRVLPAADRRMRSAHRGTPQDAGAAGGPPAAAGEDQAPPGQEEERPEL